MGYPDDRSPLLLAPEGTPAAIGTVVLALELGFVAHEHGEGVGLRQQVVVGAGLDLDGVERGVGGGDFVTGVGAGLRPALLRVL